MDIDDELRRGMAAIEAEQEAQRRHEQEAEQEKREEGRRLTELDTLVQRFLRRMQEHGWPGAIPLLTGTHYTDREPKQHRPPMFGWCVSTIYAGPEALESCLLLTTDGRFFQGQRYGAVEAAGRRFSNHWHTTTDYRLGRDRALGSQGRCFENALPYGIGRVLSEQGLHELWG